MKKHTKNTLISQVYENSTMQLKDVRFAVNAFLKLFVQALENGDTVEIRGLGIFSNKKNKKRSRYNFQLKKVTEVDEVITLAFTPSKSLKLKIKQVTSLNEELS